MVARHSTLRLGRGRYYTRKGGVFFFLSLMVAIHSTLRLAGAGTIPERVEFFFPFPNGCETQYFAVGRGRYYTRKGGVFFFLLPIGCETQYFAVGRGRYYTRKGGVFFFLSLMVARHSILRLAGAGTLPERVGSRFSCKLIFLFLFYFFLIHYDFYNYSLQLYHTTDKITEKEKPYAFISTIDEFSNNDKGIKGRNRMHGL